MFQQNIDLKFIVIMKLIVKIFKQMTWTISQAKATKIITQLIIITEYYCIHKVHKWKVNKWKWE